ncbi:energy-coupling factor transporter ATPase [bacterium]|nr:energy-coupling factor transporter ATPase [bacterium]
MNISIEHLFFEYNSPFAPRRQALTDISLQIDAGEMLAIAGAAGSGKTTLIQHFNALLSPAGGTVRIDGTDLNAQKTDLRTIRRHVGLLFQFPELQLFEETVYRDIAFGPKNLGYSREEIDRRVRRSLDLVGLDFTAFAEKSPFALSGGEKRRVAIAGVLAMEPRVLVLDEPTVGLDSRSASMIETFLRELNSGGTTVIFVSHDMDLVARLADRIAVLASGRLIYHGGPGGLFRNAALLERAGLDMPHVTRYMARLRESGLDVSTDIFTLSDAKKEIDRIKRNQ